MLKNLDPALLGVVAVRQSELIELTLSYGFDGFTLDLRDFEAQLKHGSLEHVGRLIASAKLKLGAFELPIDAQGNDEAFATEKGRLIRLSKAAGQIGASICRLTVPPANDDRPHAEQFASSRKRIGEMAKILGEQGIRLALNFDCTTAAREGFAYQFLHTFAELVKLVDACENDNVGLVIDTWQWRQSGGDMSQLDDLPAAKVFAVDLADSIAPAGQHNVTADARRLPGEGGQIDTVAILKWLASIDFEGPVTPAPAPSSFAKGTSRDNVLKQTRLALLRQWVAAGLSDEELPPRIADEAEPNVAVEEEVVEEAVEEVGAAKE